MPIDYSKWDAIQDSTSEDEIEKPIVTKFDKPQSITIQPPNYPLNTKSNCNNDKIPINNNKKRSLEEYCTNGGIVNNLYAWGQSRINIWALISLPPNSKGKNLDVKVTNESLRIKDTSTSTLLMDKVFTFTVNSEYDFYNWEIVQHSDFINDDKFEQLFTEKTIFEITFTKLEKFDSMCSWWPSLFKGDPNVNVENFKDRKGDYTTFKKNWDEANRMFREKVANFKKIEL